MPQRLEFGKVTDRKPPFRYSALTRVAFSDTDAQGNVLGAAGASGGTGDEDEAACAFGIEKAGLVADVAA